MDKKSETPIDMLSILDEKVFPVDSVQRAIYLAFRKSGKNTKGIILSTNNTPTDWDLVVERLRSDKTYDFKEVDWENLESEDQIPSGNIIVKGYEINPGKIQETKQLLIREKVNDGSVGKVLVLAKSTPNSEIFSAKYPWMNGPVQRNIYWAISKKENGFSLERHLLDSSRKDLNTVTDTFEV